MTGTEAAIRRVADFADQYRTEVLPRFLNEVDPDGVPDVDSERSLRLFFRLYGFNRQGAPRKTYAENANAALETAASDGKIDVEKLWMGFEDRCREVDVGTNPPCTRGVVEGAARLVNREGNLFQWVGREIDDHGRLAVPCEELLEFNGIGPKIARFFLRDAVWFCGVEDGVRPADRHLLQSLTGPVKLVAERIWPDLDDATERRMEKRIVTACSKYGVSGVEFNQGAWYLGREKADYDPDVIDD